MRQIRLAVPAALRLASLAVLLSSVAATMSAPGKRCFAPVLKAEPAAAPADVPVPDDGLVLEEHQVVVDWSDNKPALETLEASIRPDQADAIVVHHTLWLAI